MAKTIDWTSYAGFAEAVLCWPAQQFWQSTPAEFYTALKGRQRHLFGIDVDAGATPEDLERLKARFPDT